MAITRKKTGVNPKKIDEIYHGIKKSILMKSLYPGQRLSENTLARKHDLSRTPIREILKRLEQDGLVRIKPKSGTYVQRRSNRKIIELYQVRTYLECLAFRLALDRATPSDVARLSRLAAGFERSVGAMVWNPGAVTRAHHGFHRELVKISGNGTLLGFFDRLHLPEAHIFDESPVYEGRRRTCREHHELVQLLQRRSHEGERLMWKHLWENAEFLVTKKNSIRGKHGSAPSRPGSSFGTQAASAVAANLPRPRVDRNGKRV